MKKQLCIATLCALFLAAGVVQAQQLDAAFGFGTISGPSGASATGNFSPQTVGGGFFPSVSGDFLLKRHIGFEANVSWRGKQGLYFGSLPFRPIWYDFNAMYEREFAKRIGVEVVAGIGAQSTRFYSSNFNCGFTGCTNYQSSNHFLGDFGGGLRLYVMKSIFIRPEVRYYMVRNNFEFSGGHATRVGASIGYTFRPGI